MPAILILPVYRFFYTAFQWKEEGGNERPTIDCCALYFPDCHLFSCTWSCTNTIISARNSSARDIVGSVEAE